uniref:Uncharacterized protein n=1 Tax=Arundo donax TaxID=35708 RepID=A0A0A8ZMH7_ARUDO
MLTSLSKVFISNQTHMHTKQKITGNPNTF